MGLPNCTATGFAEKELGRAGEISATATVSEVKCSIAKRGGGVRNESLWRRFIVVVSDEK